jgi:hypothetical protein
MTQNTSAAVMQRRAEPHEEWRPIPLWEGYEVSDLGRVRSWKQRAKGRVWIPDRTQRPRILKGDIRNGYLSVLLCDKAAGRLWKCVHRLVLEVFWPTDRDGLHAAHDNGDRMDNRLANLRWATPKENAADKRRHGTWQVGERAGSARLTDEQANEIRSRRASGTRVASLAAEYGVCRNTITNLSTGRTYRAMAERVFGEEAP